MTTKTARARPRSAFDGMVEAGQITDPESASLTLRHSSPDVVSALCGPCPWPVREPMTEATSAPKRTRAPRKPSLASQIDSATKAVVKHGATAKIGDITITPAASAPADNNSANEWDEVLPKGTLQ